MGDTAVKGVGGGGGVLNEDELVSRLSSCCSKRESESSNLEGAPLASVASRALLDRALSSAPAAAEPYVSPSAALVLLPWRRAWKVDDGEDKEPMLLVSSRSVDALCSHGLSSVNALSRHDGSASNADDGSSPPEPLVLISTRIADAV